VESFWIVSCVFFFFFSFFFFRFFFLFLVLIDFVIEFWSLVSIRDEVDGSFEANK